MLIENMQRVDLDIADQAEGVRRLIQDHAMSQADIATNLGVSKEWVKDRLAILNLPETALGETSPGHRLSVKHLAILGSLDEDRRTRLLDKDPVPSVYVIEEAWNKQQSKLAAERTLTKLVKDGYLAVTEKDLKRLLKAEVTTLSGQDMVVKQALGAASRMGDTWARCDPGETIAVLNHIHGKMENRTLERNRVYVVKNQSGYQSWFEVTFKSNAAEATTDVEPDEYDLITERNNVKRADHKADCKKAEVHYVDSTKPAELIACLLRNIVESAATGYRSFDDCAEICDRLDLDVTDVGSDVSVEVRRGNHARNVAAIDAYASKNSANLARAAATVEIVHAFGQWSGVDYPAEPDYEQYPDEEDSPL
jgi:ParB-like chromosome segregation protein Spo0J